MSGDTCPDDLKRLDEYLVLGEEPVPVDLAKWLDKYWATPL